MATANIKITRAVMTKALPKSVGGLLDRRWQLKLQKEALEAELKKVDAEIKLVEDAIFLSFGKQGDLEGARGKLCQASISRPTIPIAEDWHKIYAFIRKGRGDERFSLIQKRLGVTAVKEYFDDDKPVPGVGFIEKQKLSLTKVK